MKVSIETIPHEAQRYATQGDWRFNADQDVLEISVSIMGDWRKEAEVAVHELVEALLCRSRGITTKEVDDFDMTYEGDGEPGDDPQAPYHREHKIALIAERILELGW